MKSYYSEKDHQHTISFKNYFFFLRCTTLILSLSYAFSYDFFSNIDLYLGIGLTLCILVIVASMTLLYRALDKGCETNAYWFGELLTTVLLLAPAAWAIGQCIYQATN